MQRASQICCEYEASGSGNVSGSHIYADNGVFAVTVTVEDDGGGASADTLIITVDNVAPAVHAGSDSAVGGIQQFNMLPATFADPGSADTHTATVDWGDDAITVAFVNEGRKSVSSSHRYQDNVTFAVTVTVTDDDGDSGSDSFQITVTSVPVAVTIPTVTEWGLLFLGFVLSARVVWRSRRSVRRSARLPRMKRSPTLSAVTPPPVGRFRVPGAVLPSSNSPSGHIMDSRDQCGQATFQNAPSDGLAAQVRSNRFD